MKPHKLVFEKRSVEIRETYVDDNGHIVEMSRTALIPTGRCISADELKKENSEVEQSN